MSFYTKSCVFQIHGLVNFHGQSQSFGCCKIERKAKLLVPKLGNFQKYVDCQKTTIPSSCVVGDYYY